MIFSSGVGREYIMGKLMDLSGKVFIANTLIQTPCTSCDGSGKARK
jgi:hypothetical protein